MEVKLTRSGGIVSATTERPPRVVCIVSIPRTGTNYLCSTLSRLREIESRFEIFHPDRSYTMRPDELMELSRLSGRVFEPSPEDPDAVGAIRDHPSQALDCILRLMHPQKRLLTFKVFPHHLSPETVKNELIARRDAMIVFVRRRPIDTYISHQKATDLGKWSQVDTTNFKIPIDATQFLNWWQRAADWYQLLEAACVEHGKALHHLSYEQDIDANSTQLAQRLSKLLESNGVLDLSAPNADQPMGTSRQDRTEEIERRVINWSAFYDQLSAMGAKDKAFDPIPHFTPTYHG